MRTSQPTQPHQLVFRQKYTAFQVKQHRVSLKTKFVVFFFFFFGNSIQHSPLTRSVQGSTLFCDSSVAFVRQKSRKINANFIGTRRQSACCSHRNGKRSLHRTAERTTTSIFKLYNYSSSYNMVFFRKVRSALERLVRCSFPQGFLIKQLSSIECDNCNPPKMLVNIYIRARSK